MSRETWSLEEFKRNARLRGKRTLKHGISTYPYLGVYGGYWISAGTKLKDTCSVIDGGFLQHKLYDCERNFYRHLPGSCLGFRPW